MKFLIDTNIFIPLEPTSFSDLEDGTSDAVRTARLIMEGGHQIYLHPAALVDIRQDQKDDRRKLREILFEKYPRLPDPPRIPSLFKDLLGQADPNTNDWVDQHLIAALDADSADFLISEDVRLRNKASRLNLRDRVLSVSEAITVIQDLFDITPVPPPSVECIKAHSLDSRDPIFDSFREDYPSFDEWLTKCKREHRLTWKIKGSGSFLAAFCIVKHEKDNDYGLDGKVLKVCSFKVSKQHNGYRFGELLLKTTFEYANANSYDWLYTTTFEKQEALMYLFRTFGFTDTGARTNLGEAVLAKPMTFSEKERDAMDPLSFNVRFGPFAVKLKSTPAFVVPIKPKYHRLLFPDAEKQLSLAPGKHPFGNSLRKAYLSNAVTRRISPGSNLLFYRSGDTKCITTLGVVEDTLASSSPEKIAQRVGKRTVYKFHEIESLCSYGQVLAILFRQSTFLRDPIGFDELIGHGALTGAPQSIVSISKEGVQWLHARLNA